MASSLVQVRLADGLEQVVLHAEADGLPGVVKFPVAADDDELRRQLLLAGPLNDLQPGHARHLDIRDDDVRLLAQDDFHGVDAVLAGAQAHQAQVLPVDQLVDQLADIRFVVHNQYLQHRCVLLAPTRRLFQGALSPRESPPHPSK